MKKIKFIGLGVVAISLCLATVSCNEGGSVPKASLKTANDSISYAFGASISNGITAYAEQQGIIETAAAIEYEYSLKIAEETDSLKIKGIEKELDAKIKDLKKTNNAKIDKFAKAILKGMNMADNDKETALGIGIGNQIASQMLATANNSLYGEGSTTKISREQVVAALVSELKGEELAISEFEANQMVEKVMTKSQEEAMAKQEEELKAQYEEAIAIANNFLESNKAKEGIVALESGLQYEVIIQGKGEIPTLTDKVKVHYHGTLIDGTVFDSSVERGEPITFGVTQVIKGWTEALQLMPAGSRWKLYIPADLAYGSQERGAIKPYSTLIFDVELLGIEK